MPAKQKNVQNYLGPAVAVYLDDICLAGDSFQEMLHRLNALFNRIRAAALLLKAKKWNIFQNSVMYLGHEISHQGIKIDDNKITKILHLPKPSSIAELRTFLGLITY